MCKKGDCWSTRYIKEKYNKAKEGFKRYIHQYLIDNDINDNFDKDIIAIAFNILTLTTVLTTTSSNFFYNNYSIKHFMTLNRPIPIETAKNIVISINNNAFAYSLTNSIKLSGIEPGIIRRGDINNKSSNNKVNINSDKPVNIENLTVNIDILDCHFNNNG